MTGREDNAGDWVSLDQTSLEGLQHLLRPCVPLDPILELCGHLLENSQLILLRYFSSSFRALTRRSIGESGRPSREELIHQGCPRLGRFARVFRHAARGR